MIYRGRNLFVLVRYVFTNIFKHFVVSILHCYCDVDALLYVVDIDGLLRLGSAISFPFEQCLHLYREELCLIILFFLHIALHHHAHHEYLLMMKISCTISL
jgi:hypothetical protein